MELTTDPHALRGAAVHGGGGGLGRIIAPSFLRAAGLRLTTLAEHYKVPARR